VLSSLLVLNGTSIAVVGPSVALALGARPSAKFTAPVLNLTFPALPRIYWRGHAWRKILLEKCGLEFGGFFFFFFNFTQSLVCEAKSGLNFCES
jgi:hypothetical protein